MALPRRLPVVLVGVLLGTGALAWAIYDTLFSPPVLYTTDAHPLDVAVGDVDGDGHADVLTANRDGRSISVFLGRGDGRLEPLPLLDTGFGATSLALTDLDGDAYPDLVVTGCTPGCRENAILFYRGAGDGGFAAAGSIPASGVPYNVAVADLDADGRPDLAASDYPGDRLLIFLGRSADDYLEVSLPTGDKPVALAIADLNADGRPDLISADHGSGGSTIYLSLGRGEFDGPIRLATGELPYSIAVAHLDADEIPDLAVAHSTDPGTISIWRGRGNGTFEFRQEIAVLGTPVYIDAADLDTDHRPDLIITRHDERFAGVFFNDGDGLFSEAEIRVEAENKIYALAITDLDGDPFPDLVTVDYEQDTVSVSKGRPFPSR